MFIGIHHCEILVTDLSQALEFYKETLGLEELHNPSSFSGSKWIKIGKQQLHLTYHPNNEHFILSDFQKAQAFLKCYIGSQGTFNSYRREIERLLHWSWVIAKKSLKD